MIIYIQDILEPDYNEICRFLIDMGEEIGTEKTDEGLHNLEVTLSKKSKTSIDVDGTGARFYNYDSLPVCPVYGLGACTIVCILTPSSPAPVLFLWGMLLATTAEYGTAVFYERILQVSFWDYSHLPFNLHGRVCLPLSLIWGMLSIPLVRQLHPMVAALPAFLPRPLGFCLLLTFLCDCLISALLLRHHRHRDCLNWYHSLA